MVPVTDGSFSITPQSGVTVSAGTVQSVSSTSFEVKQISYKGTEIEKYRNFVI